MKLNIVLIINSLLLIASILLSFPNYNEVYIITAYFLTGLLFIIGVIGCIDYKALGYMGLVLSVLACGFLIYIQIIN